jgi:hypothetical protein
MATPPKPQNKTLYGNKRLWVVDTIANLAAPDKDEINAGDYISCYPLSDQAGPTSTPNKVTLPVLMCETDATQDFGTTSHEHPDVKLVYDPQAATGSAGKKAWDIFKDGYTGNFVWEFGEDADGSDQIVAGKFVTTVPVKAKVMSEEPTSHGEEGLMAFDISVVVTGPVQRNVAVVA